MFRYMVVHHPDQDKPLSIHHLLRSYHWEAIGAEHVLVLADVDPHHIDTLHAHPDVLLAPSVLSPKPLHTHAKENDKMHHYLLLKTIGVEESHTAAHLADLAVKTFGSKMSLNL
jgi:hypothetical protein